MQKKMQKRAAAGQSDGEFRIVSVASGGGRGQRRRTSSLVVQRRDDDSISCENVCTGSAARLQQTHAQKGAAVANERRCKEEEAGGRMLWHTNESENLKLDTG